MELAHYSDEDAAPVAQLLAALPGHPATSEQAFRSYAAQSFNRRARDFRTLRIRGQLVALLTSALLPERTPSRRHFRILVHPDFQGRGIGLRLLEALEGQAIEPDEIAQCNSQLSWTACNSFLEHFGFAVEERERLMRIVRPLTDAPAPPVSHKMAIRMAVPSDDMDWAALHLQAYQERDDFSELTAGDQNQARATPGFSLVVAEGKMGLVGYCHIARLDAEEGLINSLVVRPDVQGLGLGRLLLAHGLQELWSQSVATVSLNVLATNSAAIRVYEKTGFRGYDELLRYQRKTRAPRGQS